MKMTEFKAKLEAYVEKIDGALAEYLSAADNPQKKIYEAMAYSIFAGGKRLRSVLLLEACRICGGDEAEAMPFACAMEMIHTYSLIHDDLPAMDNDDLRRGRPTSHIKFGEATAILAGDSLLNKAFETMAQSTSANALRAIGIIANSSGTEGMIGGQIVDMESEGKEIDLETLRYLHSLKTGAIIRSSCVAGAVLGGGDEEAMAAMDKFAVNLGIAFQIRDDILDVTGTEEELGKPIGSDKEQGKNTYVSLLGLEKSEELVTEYSAKAKAALAVFADKAEFLLAMTDYLVDRKK